MINQPITDKIKTLLTDDERRQLAMEINANYADMMRNLLPPARNEVEELVDLVALFVSEQAYQFGAYNIDDLTLFNDNWNFYQFARTLVKFSNEEIQEILVRLRRYTVGISIVSELYRNLAFFTTRNDYYKEKFSSQDLLEVLKHPDLEFLT